MAQKQDSLQKYPAQPEMVYFWVPKLPAPFLVWGNSYIYWEPPLWEYIACTNCREVQFCPVILPVPVFTTNFPTFLSVIVKKIHPSILMFHVCQKLSTPCKFSVNITSEKFFLVRFTLTTSLWIFICHKTLIIVWRRAYFKYSMVPFHTEQ